MAEILPFGVITNIFSNIKVARIKKSISRKFGLQIAPFESWLTIVTLTRNSCCHHARVWNKQNTIRPMLPNRMTGSWISLPTDTLRIYFDLCIIKYFRAEPLEASLGQLLLKGLVALIAGVFFLIRTEWLVSVFPVLTIIYGVAILFVGLGKIQKTVDMLRLKKNGRAVTAISALLSVAFGVIILAVPFETTEFLWKFTGIALIVEAVIDIAAVIASGMKKKAPAEEPKEDEKAKEE